MNKSDTILVFIAGVVVGSGLTRLIIRTPDLGFGIIFIILGILCLPTGKKLMEGNSEFLALIGGLIFFFGTITFLSFGVVFLFNYFQLGGG